MGRSWIVGAMSLLLVSCVARSKSVIEDETIVATAWKYKVVDLRNGPAYFDKGSVLTTAEIMQTWLNHMTKQGWEFVQAWGQLAIFRRKLKE